MAQRTKVIAWGVGLGLLIGAAGPSRSQDVEKPATVTLDADHEPLLVVIKRICVTQGIGFVANDAALERAGKVSFSLHEVPLETALEVICDAYSLEAHVKNRILVVRLRDAAQATTPPAAAPPASETPNPRRFLPQEATEIKPERRVERDPTSPPTVQPETAPLTTMVIHASTVTSGGGRLVVGTVVDVMKDGLRVKEAQGDPRDFFVPQGDDEGARSSRMALALKRLKVGDRVALEYRVVEGRSFVSNLVGGGNPQPKP